MTFKAQFHETAMYWCNRPLQYLIGRSTRFFGPVSYFPGNTTYFINDIEIAREILMDTEHFSLNTAGGLGYLISDIMGKNAHALFNMEGKEHMQLKRLLIKILSPQYIEKVIKDSLSPELKILEAKIQNCEEVDMVVLAKRCTSRLSCHMLGISTNRKDFEKSIAEVSKLADALTRMLSITSVYPTAKQRRDAQAIYHEFTLLVKTHYDSKHHVQHSIISELKKQGMSFDDAKALLITLIIAGTETVAVTLPRLCAILIDDEKWEKYSHDVSLISKVVSEGMRVTVPAPAILQGVKKNTAIGKYTFKANRRVIILLLNILSDDKYFSRANEFNPNRVYDPRYRTFWFGAGAHYCLGAQLAQQELSYIFNKLFSLSHKPVIIKRRYSTQTSFPGYQTLVIKFT